jgi:hypothetical protein
MVKFLDSIDDAGTIDLNPPDRPIVAYSTWDYFWSRLNPLADTIICFSEKIEKVVKAIVNVAKDIIYNAPGPILEAAKDGAKHLVIVALPMVIHSVVLDNVLKCFLKDGMMIQFLVGVSATGTGVYLVYYNIKQLQIYLKAIEKKHLFHKKAKKLIEKGEVTQDPFFIKIILIGRVCSNLILFLGGLYHLYRGANNLYGRWTRVICIGNKELELKIMEEIESCPLAEELFDRAKNITKGALQIMFKPGMKDYVSSSLDGNYICISQDTTNAPNAVYRIEVSNLMTGAARLIYEPVRKMFNESCIKGNLTKESFIKNIGKVEYDIQVEQSETLVRCIEDMSWPKEYLKLTSLDLFYKYYKEVEAEISHKSALSLGVNLDDSWKNFYNYKYYAVIWPQQLKESFWAVQMGDLWDKECKIKYDLQQLLKKKTLTNRNE